MKENKYDEEQFFEAYSNFPRSVVGLQAAGEWHELKRMLPDFEGKSVLDIGCGFGWHCQYAARHGASHVLGTDISGKMLAVANDRNVFPSVDFRRTSMEDMQFPEACFDVVISSLAFHYTPVFAEMCRNIFGWLTPGGIFIFSVEHPVFTAEGSQEWLLKENGEKIWPVNNYFSEGERTASFLGSNVVKYHRTLTTYLREVSGSGFHIREIIEPQPETRMVNCVEGMADELKRPMMLIISAVKPSEMQC